MKKLLAFIAVALMVGAYLAPPANAFQFAQGPNLGKLIDWGSFFRPSANGGPVASPLPVGVFQVGDWDHTLATLTDLYSPDTGYPSDKYYSGLDPELNVLAYDLKIGAVRELGVGTNVFQIDLISAGRYAADGYTGGRIDIWEDPANNLDAEPSNLTGIIGPSNWGFGSAGDGDGNPFEAGEYDTFPTATDGTATPLLSGTFVPYDPVNKPGVLFTLTLDFVNGTGSSTQGFILLTYNVSGTPFQTMTNAAGVTYQISFVNRFDFFPNTAIHNYETPNEPFDKPNTPAVYWATHSQDPIRFTAIPEPATLSLLGIALMGLGGIARRRKA